MIEVVISIDVPGWINEISDEYKMKVIGAVSYEKGGAKDLMEIDIPEGKMDDAINRFKNHPSIKEAEIVPISKGKALASISTLACPVCATLADSNSFLVNADIKEGKIRWRLLSSGKNPIKTLIQKLEDSGLKAEIISIKSIKSKKELTSRQEEIVRLALEEGYFDYPKRISIRELAKRFDISISTLSEILRSGQKKILGSYFTKNY